MDFLKKARRKAEAAMKEMQETLDKKSQPQLQNQPQQSFNAGYTPQYQQPPVQQQSFYPSQPSQATGSSAAQFTQPIASYSAISQYEHQRAGSHQQTQNHNVYSPLTNSFLNSGTQPSYQKCLAQEEILTKYFQFHCLRLEMDFAVCSACFNSRIVPYSSLAQNFTPFQSPSEDHPFICDFSFPRTQWLFLSQCIPRNSIQPLLESYNFIVHSNLTQCDGEPVPGPEQMYTTKAVTGFACCRTCFEFNIKHTPLERNFSLVSYPADQSWICDIVHPSYRGMLNVELDKAVPNITHISQEAKRKMTAPACTGPGNPISVVEGEQTLVYSAHGGKTGNMCIACYYDHLANTALAQSFVLAYLSDEQVGTIHCDLASGSSKSAMAVAVQRGDEDIWRDFVALSVIAVACGGIRGVDEADLIGVAREDGSNTDWYQAIDYPKVEICSRHYHMKIKLLGAAHLFSPIDRPLSKNVIRMCFLTDPSVGVDASIDDAASFENTLIWRGKRLYNTMSAAYDTGDWSSFLTVCKDISTLPPPCGGNKRGFFQR